MSEELQQKNSFGSTVKSALAFPVAIQGVGAFNAARRAGGVKNAVENLQIKEFKKFNNTLKTGPAKDVFSRGLVLSNSYENYKGICKNYTKLSKKAAKIAKRGDKLSIADRFLNLFRKNKVTVDSVKNASANATEVFNNTKKLVGKVEITEELATALKSGDKAAIEAAKKAASAKGAIKGAEAATKSVAKAGFKNTAKTLAKKELTSKFNLAITTLTTFIPAMTSNVIPAFKEQGFTSGMKELGKAVFKTAADFASFALGGALGRTLGMTIGTIVCPGAGSAVGGMIGDAVGSMLVGGKICEKVDEIVDSKKEKQQSQQTQAQNATQNINNLQNAQKLNLDV